MLVRKRSIAEQKNYNFNEFCGEEDSTLAVFELQREFHDSLTFFLFLVLRLKLK